MIFEWTSDGQKHRVEELFEYTAKWSVKSFGKWFMDNHPHVSSGLLKINSVEIETPDYEWTPKE